MYNRQFGDNLCKNNKKLKLTWEWSRVASGYSTKELRSWTHFQCSKSSLDDWVLESIQWGSDEWVNYEARIQYMSNLIASSEGHKTRLEAQIAAEKLLLEWVNQQREIVEQALKEQPNDEHKHRRT